MDLKTFKLFLHGITKNPTDGCYPMILTEEDKEGLIRDISATRTDIKPLETTDLKNCIYEALINGERVTEETLNLTADAIGTITDNILNEVKERENGSRCK